MARKAKPENAAKRERTEKWRAGQKFIRRPEASQVDMALAAAVAALLQQQEERKVVSDDLSIIVRSASAILEDRGFDGKAGARKLMTRLRFRRDLPRLRTILVPPMSVTTGPGNGSGVSPLLRK